MKKLFVSYRRTNWSFTYWLAEELGKLIEAELFVDFSGIDESNFESSLLRNLSESEALLLIVTEHTFDQRIYRPNDWVRREIRTALEQKKPIVLALYEGKTPPSDPNLLPEDILLIQKAQGVEFYPRFFKAGVHELALFIAKSTSIELQDNAARAPSEVKVHPRANQAERLKTAYALIEAGDYTQALTLLNQLQSEGYQPKILDLNELITRAKNSQQSEERRWEAGQIYDEIEILTHVNLSRARAAWIEFQQSYPDFKDDPAKLAARFTNESGVTLKIPEIEIKRTNQVERIIGIPFEWCYVEAGTFLYGTEKLLTPLDEFYISKYPITYGQYQVFLEANDGYFDGRWWADLSVEKSHRKQYGEQFWKIENHPCEMVSWYDAVAFSRWLSNRLGGHYAIDQIDSWLIRLPTEIEWEKAARGTDGRIYPWGSEYILGNANVDESNLRGGQYLGKTSPVVDFQGCISPYKLLNMSGNVWEWTLTDFETGDNHNLDAKSGRVYRGGSYIDLLSLARVDFRDGNYPQTRKKNLGFRIVTTSTLLGTG